MATASGQGRITVNGRYVNPRSGRTPGEGIADRNGSGHKGPALHQSARPDRPGVDKAQEVTMRHLMELVKVGGEDTSGDDDKESSPSGGCGDGDGCGRK